MRRGKRRDIEMGIHFSLRIYALLASLIACFALIQYKCIFGWQPPLRHTYSVHAFTLSGAVFCDYKIVTKQ